MASWTELGWTLGSSSATHMSCQPLTLSWRSSQLTMSSSSMEALTPAASDWKPLTLPWPPIRSQERSRRTLILRTPQSASAAAFVATLLAWTRMSTNCGPFCWASWACWASSPGAVSSLLGLGQWFAVLCRPSFSAFHRCYRFARREPLEEVCDVPTAVVGELLSFALLAPLLGGALDAEWAPLLVASDAAPDFGFGVSVASLPSDEVRLLGLKSERRGDYVRFDRFTDKLLEPERPRVGRRVPLPVSATAFRDVISKRAEIREHSGILKLRGVRLAVRWALRSARWFGRRLLLLVDAKAALCAVAKGRSGAFSFRRPLASIGAHALASGCQLRCLYIPSEDNTADAPSRGKRRRPSRKRILKQRRHCKADRRLFQAAQRMQRCVAVLREHGLLASSSDSTPSSASL